MAIKVKLGKDRTIVGGTGSFYLVCDYCGKEITTETPANCEYEEKEGSSVFFIHKSCSSAFRTGKPKMLWSEFVRLEIIAK